MPRCKLCGRRNQLSFRVEDGDFLYKEYWCSNRHRTIVTRKGEAFNVDVQDKKIKQFSAQQRQDKASGT